MDVKTAVETNPNTMVLLAPDVEIKFSNQTVKGGDGKLGTWPSGAPFINFPRCVTLASFERTSDGTAPVPGSGRTPHSLGPALKYSLEVGPNGVGRTDTAVFIEMACKGDNPLDPEPGEVARVLGSRLLGPDPNDHHTSETGINILGCQDVEIANIEIAGWGSAAITVDNSPHTTGIPEDEPAPILIRIHDNYIHNNQHSSSGGHSLGYGVDVDKGAFAQIERNVFDYNKHSVTAGGKAGGYVAVHNLILKGGGFQNSEVGPFGSRDIHVFDVHGTSNCPELPGVGGVSGGAGIGAGVGAGIGGLFGGVWGAVIGGLIGGLIGGIYGGLADLSHAWFNCGDAGLSFMIDANTFQYSKTTDLKIRGKPKKLALISNNVFARPKGSIVLPDWYDYLGAGADEYSIVL